MQNDIEVKNIKLIIFGVDASMLKSGSAVRLRTERYAKLVKEIDVILFGTDSIETFKLGTNITIHPIASSWKIGAAIKGILLTRRLATPETLISAQDPFELGFMGWLASKITKAPLHVQVHIDFFSEYFRKESLRQRFQATVAPFVLHRAHGIRVVSQKLATYLRDVLQINAKQITIAPVFVDSEKVKVVPILTDLHAKYVKFDWIVLVAARYVKQKNIPLAIEAFEMFHERYPKAGMVIAGAGKEESAIKAIVQKNGLDAFVKVGGWSTEFASCMKTSDVFVMSSDYEGWGMTVIEAAALSKPIVMTDVGCAGEFLVNNVNGLVVPTRDPAAMARALENYYVNRAFSANMGQSAGRDASTYMTEPESDALMASSWVAAMNV